jgi:hypothetical protein
MQFGVTLHFGITMVSAKAPSIFAVVIDVSALFFWAVFKKQDLAKC